MFESLTDKLQGAFKKFGSRGRVTEEDLDLALREVRMAMLEADVNFRVVREFTSRVKERALGAEVLRSLTPAGVTNELAARMVALNVVRMILLASAEKHGEDPLRLSFLHAVRAVMVFAPAMATAPVWKLPAIYAAMLKEIASHRIPLRPGRNEPRAVRREHHHYPTLRTTRQLWRLQHAA